VGRTAICASCERALPRMHRSIRDNRHIKVRSLYEGNLRDQRTEGVLGGGEGGGGIKLKEICLGSSIVIDWCKS